MKRILSLLLAVIILSGTFALAEEAATEVTSREAFCEGLTELLTDFDPTGGDQAALSLAYSGQEVISLMLKGAEELIELTVHLPSEEIDTQVQFTPEEAYLAMNGSAIGARYEDLPALTEAAVKAALSLQGISMDPDAVKAIDIEILEELFQLLAQTAILKHVTMNMTKDAVILNYTATGNELIADLCEFTDQVLAEEKYRPLLEQIWTEAKAVTDDVNLPELEEIIAMWPAAKETLSETETDFSLALEAYVRRDRNYITLNAELGMPDDLFLADFSLTTDPAKGKVNANIKLTERVTRIKEGETVVRDYDILSSFDLITRNGGAIWSFEINYPSQYFTLSMNGSHLDTVGRVTLEVTNMRRSRNSFDAKLKYELDEDGLAGDLTVMNAYGEETELDLNLSETTFTFTVSRDYSRDIAMRRGLNDQTSDMIFALKAEADENHIPQYASLITENFSVEYDGEQINIVTEDLTLHCVGEFISDREYLITITSEEEYPGDTAPAFIRVTYEDKEDGLLLRAVLIEPEGSELASADFVISPAGPVEPLSNTGDLLMLTPEIVEQLTGMLLSD